MSYLLELVDEADKNKDGKIDYDEWEIMGTSCGMSPVCSHTDKERAVQRIKKRIPMAEDQLLKVRELFDLYDSDSDNSLNLNELAVLLQEVGNKITALPAVRFRPAL